MKTEALPAEKVRPLPTTSSKIPKYSSGDAVEVLTQREENGPTS